MFQRYAIYYAPDAASELWRLASQWLGRDPTGEAVTMRPTGLDASLLDGLCVSARRYGFHATLKAPMGLAAGHDVAALQEALAEFANGQSPIDAGPMILRLIGGFTALTPANQSAELTDLAAGVVTVFDRFRSPMNADERARRKTAGLSVRQIELLDHYGYPYVLEQFELHMTLTDRLPADRRDAVIAAASDWFAPMIGRHLAIDRLVLFCEPEPGAPFVRLNDFLFKASS